AMHRDLGCFGRWKPLPLGWATALALRALRIVREAAGEPLRLPRALGSTALRRYLRGKAAAHHARELRRYRYLRRQDESSRRSSYACLRRSEERRVGKECRSRWAPDH